MLNDQMIRTAFEIGIILLSKFQKWMRVLLTHLLMIIEDCLLCMLALYNLKTCFRDWKGIVTPELWENA